MMSDDEIIIECTPPNIIDAANAISDKILPDKSRKRYEFVYNKFMRWRCDNNVTSFSENVLLAYMGKISNDLKPSTVWSMYSMLRNTINIKHNVDISKYAKLKAFLKRTSTGFHSKKSKILTTQEIQRYINDAPDDKHLFNKVALVFGIAGACRSQELQDIDINNIQDLGKTFLVTIPNTKTYTPRSFTVVGNYYNICKKYINLRPPGINNITSRFFLNYQNGRCTKQVIGINKFGNVPKQIAQFLNLPNPELYTGHSFRRSSTTLLADTGANMTDIKQHGGWKSNTVAEQYIEDSLNNKIKRGNKIFASLENSSNSGITVKTTNDKINSYESTSSNPPIIASIIETIVSTNNTEIINPKKNPTTINFNNCTFNINQNNK